MFFWLWSILINQFSIFSKISWILINCNQNCLKEFRHVVKSCKINQSSDIPDPHKVISRTCETHLAVKNDNFTKFLPKMRDSNSIISTLHCEAQQPKCHTEFFSSNQFQSRFFSKTLIWWKICVKTGSKIP